MKRPPVVQRTAAFRDRKRRNRSRGSAGLEGTAGRLPGGYVSVYLFYFSGSLSCTCKIASPTASFCPFLRFMISFPTTTTPKAKTASAI